jgi:photosystem II stability/assembly factor-like uncharacterized protein
MVVNSCGQKIRHHSGFPSGGIRMFKFVKVLHLVAILAVTVPLIDCRVAQGVTDPMLRPSLMASHAAESVLLGIAAAGERLVAVGENGYILLSDDNGRQWRQVKTPVSVTLTAVQFVTPKTGWAVGHFGIVLKSVDGGESWVKQLDGVQAAQIILAAAKSDQQCVIGQLNPLEQGQFEAAKTIDFDRRLAIAKRFVDDGPDKPFLDLYFENDQTGFILGAFNLIFRTQDGGKTWDPWLKNMENPRGMHLYDMARIGDDLFIAGEQGVFLRSTDGGRTFKALKTPYRGSYFGVIRSGEASLLLFGLRGNIFLRSINMEDWQEIDSGATLSITAGTVTRNGDTILVTEDGLLLESRDDGRTLAPLGNMPAQLTGVIEAADGSLVLVGSMGVMRVEP